MILIVLRTVTPSVCQQQMLAILARDAPHTDKCSPDVYMLMTPTSLVSGLLPEQ